MSQEMLEAGPQSARILSVFDFDGTLTRRDSFVPFLRFAFGNGFFCSPHAADDLAKPALYGAADQPR